MLKDWEPSIRYLGSHLFLHICDNVDASKIKWYRESAFQVFPPIHLHHQILKDSLTYRDEPLILIPLLQSVPKFFQKIDAASVTSEDHRLQKLPFPYTLAISKQLIKDIREKLLGDTSYVSIPDAYLISVRWTLLSLFFVELCTKSSAFNANDGNSLYSLLESVVSCDLWTVETEIL
jgi:hypothetical protein